MNFDLTEQEAQLLERLTLRKYTPIARLELRKEGEMSCISTALDHVLLWTKDDDIETLKLRGPMLASLEERGFIKLEYDLLVTAKQDYVMYTQSEVFALLKKMVEEGKGRPDFLFDTAFLMRGRASVIDKA